MNRASLIALVLAGILFGCAAGMAAHEVIESEAVAYEGQKWEYIGKGWAGMTDEKATALGEAGWEMVVATQAEIWFKRPLP